MDGLFAVFSEEPNDDDIDVDTLAANLASAVPKSDNKPSDTKRPRAVVDTPPVEKRARQDEDSSAAAAKAAEKLEKSDRLTTEITYEKYDVAGPNCIHECARPADDPGKPADTSHMGRAKEYSYELDVFQDEARKCLEKHESVLVAAHTSAGKTTVAEYAIAMALRDKQRIIYTSPIKALSNQKYRDMQDEFKDVGLMTGDVTINPHASIMIMTTEILRSMLYRGSDVCREMAWVVFDEVHYMRDRDRGVVWEETIILLPDSVRLVFLSATIPNAREFAEWICRIKHQPCHVIYTDKRPVPLQHYLFPAGGDGVYMVVDEKGQFREDNFHKAVSALAKTNENVHLETKKKQVNKRGKASGPDLEKIIRMCSDRGYLPVIVFSFSRKECESNAVALKKMDVTDDDEKRLIDEVFNNAIMTLGDEDRELPQVQSMLPLLRRGLGIHHGGLLPMLKEVVEILFQESLIKVLFSTETFAMGINMPAKTVVFTNTRKWDGLEYRILLSGEYIQMSGRAGRRGKDDRGLTIIMFDEKVEPEIAKNMFLGESTKIWSAFHLGYNMLLNLLRIEGADPDYMIQRSFHQFQKDKQALEIKDKKRDMETELSNIDDLRSVLKDDTEYGFNTDEAIADYYYISKELDKQKEVLRQIVIRPEHIAPFLNPGRLVYMKDGEMDWGWGILVSAGKQKVIADESVVEGEEDEVQWVLDVFLPCEPGSFEKEKPKPATGKAEGQVVPMALTLVMQISKIRSNMPTGDPKSEDSRRALLKTLNSIRNHKKFKVTGIPELEPEGEMNIKGEELSAVLSSRKDLEKKRSENKFSGNAKLQDYYDAFERKVKLHAQVQDLDKQINQSRFMVMGDDLRAMRRVLRRLEFVDKDGVVLLKGRLACELTSADEILMSEIVFQNVFADMEANNIIALCSCLVFDEKSEDPITNNLDLMKAFDTCKGIARNVAEVMQENKIPIDVEEYVQKLKPQLMDVVLMWLDGKRFYEIMNQCNLYEGSVVRVIRRLEELIRELATAAKVIGNQELEQKLNEGRGRLKRGIIFAASLYL